jgi:hypothetical protein
MMSAGAGCTTRSSSSFAVYLLDDGSVCAPREYLVIVGHRQT